MDEEQLDIQIHLQDSWEKLVVYQDLMTTHAAFMNLGQRGLPKGRGTTTVPAQKIQENFAKAVGETENAS